MSSRAIHVKIVTTLSLGDFLLMFSKFNNVRVKIDIIYFDNGSTFQQRPNCFRNYCVILSSETRFEQKVLNSISDFLTHLLKKEPGKPWLSNLVDF